ncbi:MAG: hypothetical protein EBS01_04500 [Verrucomicrobia bacterium]|nr:hypothetical protein [Verrucomicrobiota bacterium]
MGGFAYITNPTTGAIDFVATPVANTKLVALGAATALPVSGGVSTANYLLSSTTTTTAAEAANSLRITGGALTLVGSLTLTSASATSLGGILFDNSTAAASISGASIVPSVAGQELIFITGGASPANALTVSSTIGYGASSLTKGGTGLLILSGNNSYTGTTTLNEGSLGLSGSTATLGAGGALVMRQKTTLDLGGAGLIAALYTGGGSFATETVGSFSGAGVVTNSSATPVMFGIGSASTSLFSGLIQDGGASVGIIKNGAGTQYLTGMNTYSGPTVINGGVLSIAFVNTGTVNYATTITSMNVGSASPLGVGLAGASTSLAANAASLIFNNGALQYTGANTAVFSKTQSPTLTTDRLFTMVGNATIDSSGNYGSGYLTSTSQNNATLVFNSAGSVAFAGPLGSRVLTLQGSSTGDNEMGIQLSDGPGYTLGVTKAGSGLWVLSDTANSYSGDTTISGGALRANYNGLTTLSPNSNLVLAGGVLETSGTRTITVGTAPGQVRWTGSGGFAAAEANLSIRSSTPLTWGTTGFLGNGQNLILNSTTGLSSVEFAPNIDLGGGTRTVQIEDNTTTTTDFGILSGVLSNGSLAVVKGTNTGLLYITGANVYAGSTTWG